MEEVTPIKQTLEVLVKQLNLTSHNDLPEDYVLTPGEENTAIEHAIKSAKDIFLFRRLDLGEPLAKVEQKISEINWQEEINRDNILKIANSNKNYDLWVIENRRAEKFKEAQKQREIKNRYTAKFVFNLMSWVSKNMFGKDLIVNESNKHLITTICFYISQDERFEKDLGYSFTKGLLIRGISGLGKTYLFECVKDNEINPISIYSMIEISSAVKSEGEFNLPVNKTLYLDDVGTEEHIVNHYGTKINFFKNFIETYYLKNNYFNNLIISTNNNFSEIEEKYGFRVRSRIKDMFNIIDVTGTDMRGQ